MTEPLALVYTSQLRHHGSYHRAGAYYQYHRGTRTHCGRLNLDDLIERPETDAVLRHDPCHHCFPLWRGRRQNILNQIASAPIEEPA